jgi:hypothetical protein
VKSNVPGIDLFQHGVKEIVLLQLYRLVLDRRRADHQATKYHDEKQIKTNQTLPVNTFSTVCAACALSNLSMDILRDSSIGPFFAVGGINATTG